MKKIIALLLTLAMLLSLAACGGSAEEDPNAGKYLGTTAKAFGMIMEMSEIYPGETWVELQSGGKGTIMLDGDDFPMKWTLEGDVFTLTIEDEDSVGTMADGVIVVDLMGMGVEMTFVKEGIEAPAPKATYNDAGYWEIIRVDSEDPESVITEEDMAIVKEYGVLMYMELKEDGTGVLFMDGELPITWQDGSVTLTEDALTVPYTVENGEIVLDMFEAVFILRKGEKPEETAPISEMEQAGFTSFIEVGVIYPFTTITSKNASITTTGEAQITSYEVFDSAEGYPAKEGYEWRVVTMEAVFFDYNARQYGVDPSSCSEDYYNTKLHDDSITEEDEDGFETSMVVYKGVQMETYERYTGEWSGWHNREDGRRQSRLTTKYEYLMPKGYDGRVVGFVNGKNEWRNGSTYITDFDPAECLLFRLN